MKVDSQGRVIFGNPGVLTYAINSENPIFSQSYSRFDNVVVGGGTNSIITGAAGSGGVINLQNAASESYALTSYSSTSAANIFVLNARASSTSENLLQVQKNGSAQITLTNSGYLGIGTTTPSQALVVIGSTTISSLNVASCDLKADLNGGLYCGIDATGGAGSAQWTVGNGLIYNATSTDLVGIGTITPTTTLFVQGKGGVNPFVVASSTGTQLLTLTQAGNVGVGTSTPGAMFMLQGAAGTSSNLFTIASSSGSSLIYITPFGGVVQNISSTTAINILDGSTTPSSVFVVDTTQSAANSGIDITAGGSQTGNLLNFYSSGSTLLMGVSAYGGLYQNIASTTAFQIQNGSGVDVFAIDTVSKKVGIGTSTGMAALDIISSISVLESGNPSAGSSTATGLRVITSDDDSPSVLIMNSSPVPCIGQASGCSSAVSAGGPGILTVQAATTSNTSWFNLITAYNQATRTAASAVFRVRGDGNVYGEAAFNASGADYAEYFDTFDTSIDYGDLVVATTTDAKLLNAAISDAGLSSSSTSTIISQLSDVIASSSTSTINSFKEDSKLVSAIMKSQKAYDSRILGIVSNQAAFIGNNPGGRNDSNKFKKPVGLVGRVPVKVSTENGEIKTGDFVTSSGQFNGYGMKATRSGYVLGIALEDFKPFASSTALSQTPQGGTVLVFINPGFQNISNTFVLGEDYLTSQLGTATASVSSLKSDSFVINQKGSGNILQLQQNGDDRLVINNAGALSLYGLNTATSVPLSVITSSSTVFSVSGVGELKAIGHITVGRDTAGTALVNAGQNITRVTFNTFYKTIPKVVVTAQGVPDFFYGVVEKTNEGFTIATDRPLPRDVYFDWVVLEQPEDTPSVSSLNLSVVNSPSGQGEVAGVSTGGGSLPGSGIEASDYEDANDIEEGALVGPSHSETEDLSSSTPDNSEISDENTIPVTDAPPEAPIITPDTSNEETAAPLADTPADTAVIAEPAPAE